jgi:hypothetical protein
MLTPKAEWVFVADQLNAHIFIKLPTCVAELCVISKALGEKGKSGNLETLASRAAFWQCPDHDVGFV